jgi:hypothetical protein
MSDLNDILEGEEAPVETQTEQPQEAETPTEGPTRDDSGRFAPKGEEPAPPAEEDKAETGLKAAAAAERRKRQEAETRYQDDITALRRELEQLKQPKQPEAPPPSMWEDEQGWQQHFGSQVTQQAVQAAMQQNKLHTSELLMMQQHEDFPQIRQDIFRFVGENPAVNAEVQNSPHPWQAAYRAYKSHETMRQLGATDITELEAKLREKIMAEMQQQTPQTQTIPQSLADAQSSKRSAGAAGNSLSLEDILGG